MIILLSVATPICSGPVPPKSREKYQCSYPCSSSSQTSIPMSKQGGNQARTTDDGSKNQKTETSRWCAQCAKSIHIQHGGEKNWIRHLESQAHKANECIKGVPKISTFFKTREDPRPVLVNKPIAKTSHTQVHPKTVGRSHHNTDQSSDIEIIDPIRSPPNQIASPELLKDRRLISDQAR